MIDHLVTPSSTAEQPTPTEKSSPSKAAEKISPTKDTDKVSTAVEESIQAATGVAASATPVGTIITS